MIGSGFAVHGSHQFTERSNKLTCKLWTSVSGDAQWHTMMFPDVLNKQSCYVMRSGFILAWHEVSHFGQPVYHDQNGSKALLCLWQIGDAISRDTVP